MPDTTLYHGTVMLFDTETGEEVNVAVQIAVNPRRLAYTIRSLACPEHAPVTLVSEDGPEMALVVELLDRMRRVSVPA